MRILALEPYCGGSHRAFLDGWAARSRHAWCVLGLAAFKWKWRMRHSAVTFADDVAQRVRSGEQWDCVWCSDMLDLASFKGLAPDGQTAQDLYLTKSEALFLSGDKQAAKESLELALKAAPDGTKAAVIKEILQRLFSS